METLDRDVNQSSNEDPANVKIIKSKFRIERFVSKGSYGPIHFG